MWKGIFICILICSTAFGQEDLLTEFNAARSERSALKRKLERLEEQISEMQVELELQQQGNDAGGFGNGIINEQDPLYDNEYWPFPDSSVTNAFDGTNNSLRSYSIEWSQESETQEVWRLYNFLHATNAITNLASTSVGTNSGEYLFLVRKEGAIPQLEYAVYTNIPGTGGTNIVSGIKTNDMLRWNGTNDWVILPAPGTNYHVLQLNTNGNRLAWDWVRFHYP